MSDYQFNDTDAVAWRKSTFAEGIEVKDLGTASGRSMQLVRFAPGASFPLHRHEGPEFIYVLEGIAFQEGQQLSTGWAAVAATGTMDSDFHSPTGCIFLNPTRQIARKKQRHFRYFFWSAKSPPRDSLESVSIELRIGALALITDAP